MKRTAGSRILIVFTILCAVSGFLLRLAFQKGNSIWELAAVSVLAVAVILILSLRLGKVSEFGIMFRSSLPDLILSVLAAVSMFVGGILRVSQEEDFSRVLGFLAIAAAVCLAFAALTRMKGKPRTVLYAAVVIFYVIKLFYDFRCWMVDPAVPDYCFLLFASISFMIATYQSALFCFNRGKRAALAFFSLCGIYFGGICVSDLRIFELLTYGGSILWMFACGWQALRTIKEE